MGRVIEADPGVQAKVADLGKTPRPQDVIFQVDQNERRGHGESVASVEDWDGFDVDGVARQGQG